MDLPNAPLRQDFVRSEPLLSSSLRPGAGPGQYL